MASYGQRATLGFIWGLGGRIGYTIVSMGAAIVLARLLTPHDFGVAAAAGFFIQIAQRLTNLGFNTAIMRLKEIRDDHTGTVFTINVAFGLVGAVILALAAPWLGDFYDSPELRGAIPIAGATFALGCLGTVPGALLAREFRFKALVITETTYGWFVAILSIVMALAGFGYWSLIYSLLAGSVYDAVMKFSLARWRPNVMFSKAAFGELWSFGAGLHLKRLLESVALNIDNMVIGRALGLAALGVYDKAFTTMNRAVMIVSTAGQNVSVSVLSRIQDDDQRFRQAFRKVTMGIAIVGYPGMAALAGMARPLFLIMFGAQWMGAVVPFQLLCAAGALKLYITYLSSAVQAKGRVWGEVWRQGLYVAMIMSFVLAGSKFGLSGAAFGVLIATIIVSILMADLLRRVTGIQWRDLLEPQAVGIGGAVGVLAAIWLTQYALRNVYPRDVPPGLLLLGESVGCLAFMTVYFFTGPFTEARTLAQEMIRRRGPVAAPPSAPAPETT